MLDRVQTSWSPFRASGNESAQFYEMGTCAHLTDEETGAQRGYVTCLPAVESAYVYRGHTSKLEP